MALTKEQQRVVDEVCSKGDKIIAVNSVAGSGKTHTAEAVVKAYKPKEGFYTAFNRAIVQDSKKRFGKLIDAKTIHALAYQYVNPSRPIEELNYNAIKENISYEEKAIVIDTLDEFFRSSSTNIEMFARKQGVGDSLVDLVTSYANRMLEGKVAPTFNYLLKCLHLMLLHKELQIDFDLFVYDECQDVVPVTLEIFKLINADRKIMFGDRYQNIYSFMNTVNAFDVLDGLHQLKLTQSFRCAPHIADIVEDFGQQFLDDSFIFKGYDSVVPATQAEIAYISRSNAMLIERMHSLLERGVSFSLTRNLNEIFALPIALLNASAGREVFDKRYKYLATEYKKYALLKSNTYTFYEYIADITNDPVIEGMTKLLGRFAAKRINLYKIKAQVEALKKNPNIILTTAHAFKGLEMDKVFIEDDLNASVKRVLESLKGVCALPLAEDPREYLTSSQREDLNTYYVALSRARTKLINVDYRLVGDY